MLVSICGLRIDRRLRDRSPRRGAFCGLALLATFWPRCVLAALLGTSASTMGYKNRKFGKSALKADVHQC
jgi:hypothetical protein